MIETSNLAALIGADVLDSTHEKVGTVGQIFVAPETGRPRWLSIKHGLGRDWIAPLEDATSDVAAISLPYDKSFLKKAPRADAAQGLSIEQEAELDAYFDRAATAVAEHPGRHADPVE